MSISHTLVNLLVRLETAVAQLELLEDPGKNKDKLLQDKQAYTIFYTANSVGLEISLKDSYRFMREGGSHVETRDYRGQLLENFSACQKIVQSLSANKNIGVGTEILLQLNRSIGLNTIEEWQLKYRQPTDSLNNLYDDLSAVISQSHRNSNGELELASAFEQFKKLEINRFLRLSSWILAYLNIHPFIAYNKHTLVFAADLLTCRLIGTENAFINYSEFFIQKKGDILRCFLNSDPNESAAAWNVLFLEYICRSLESAVSQIRSHQQQVNGKTNRPFLDLNRRQLKILKYLQTIPTVRREDYVQMMEVSTMTAYRDLQMLVKHRLVRTMGVGRGTKYILASR